MVQALLGKLVDMYPSWEIFPTIAKDLRAILLGQVDPLGIAFDDRGLAGKFYADIFNTICDDRFRRLFALLSHENPTMRVLEVGAGTGGMTEHVLSTLGGLEAENGGNRYGEYTYTDISPSFFEIAQQKFQAYNERMSFQAFDLDKRPLDQGLEEGSYDVIIAGCVLHATKEIKTTLGNLRRLWKPQGRLVLLEVIAPHNVITNFAFGVLPGWWSAVEDFRALSPTLTESQWDRFLRDNGFTGNDLALQDYSCQDYHTFSLLVTTRQEPTHNGVSEHGRLYLVLRCPSDEKALQLACSLQMILHHYDTEVIYLHQAKDIKFEKPDYVVFLVKVELPILSTLGETTYVDIRSLIQRAHRIVWTTSSVVGDSRFPAFGLMQGFLRTIRSENADKQIITFSIEHGDVQNIVPDTIARHLVKVFTSAFETKSDEVEYRLRDGELLSARLVERKALNRNLRALELGLDEIEIEAKAWGLNFRDVFVALGRLPGDDLGGLRLRRDRHTRGTELRRDAAFVKLAPNLSFEAAASFLNPAVTAYYSLLEVARLRKGEKILVHSAAGATGQMAIQIAQTVGADIYATVGMGEKKQYLVDHFGIPADHIFYSRDTSFARANYEGARRDGLRASWECMAPFGRFIEIGKADVVANSGLPMENFASNVTFSAVDLHFIGENYTEIGTINHPTPFNIYPVADIEQAFRHLQSGKNTGRIVIRVNDTDTVRKRLASPVSWQMDPDASYVIVGGSGGIGRAIAAWMATRGAKHLILLSRSGDTTPAAAKAIAALRARGVNVAAPRCNVSSSESLASVLEQCLSTMPAVKGCIQSAMALQDSSFDTMTHAQWETTVRSKVHVSWNLHEQLPPTFDFFILLSSLAGVYGSIAQANYATGCAYQDALARYRTSQGLKAVVALDLGWMRTIGFFNDMTAIEDSELMALLEMYCDPRALPTLALRPMFSGFSLASGGTHSSSNGDTAPVAASGSTASYALMFRRASGLEERSEILIQGLASKLARAMSIASDDVVPTKQLSDYGVDSLMGVGLRNWLARDFGANVPVFDIMGSATIADIGMLVAEKTEFRG
ncbi:polyketide synthase PksD [Apiospora phragmitis]|uniref:Polyketide synthase PksD n=1 Tax=Apiospora phragmitis TaxID=2905665 RepID=A0ABR1UGY6_9PEZI